jgi:hypothetical protein
MDASKNANRVARMLHDTSCLSSPFYKRLFFKAVTMEGLLAVNAKRISGFILGIIIALDYPTFGLSHLFVI